MPYNDTHNDVFSNPPELRKFESLPPQVIQRIHTINGAVKNIGNLTDRYASSSVESSSFINPIIQQINQNNHNFDINTVRHSLDEAYGEAA